MLLGDFFSALQQGGSFFLALTLYTLHPTLNTKLPITGSYLVLLERLLHDGFISYLHYMITMRLVYDNYVIHFPCLSFR